MRELTALGCAVVFYEAAPRVAETLADIAAVCPEWRVCVGREVTKTFEEFRHGDVPASWRDELAGEKLLGECTLVIAPPADGRRRAPTPATATDGDDRRRCCARCSRRACRRRRSRRRCGRCPGIGRNQAYERVLALGRERPPADDDHPGDRQGPHRPCSTPTRSPSCARAYAKTSVDVGTGDGRFAYHLASADPDRLVIGLDALAEPMGERAATAARKPAKGGRPNLLFVHAAIEALPAELARRRRRGVRAAPVGRAARRDRARARRRARRHRRAVPARRARRR